MNQRFLRSKVLTALGLALLVAAGAVSAAPLPVSPKVTPIPDTPPLEVKDNAVLLSVNDAVEIALRRNLNLVVQRYVRDRSGQGIQQALGIYDLTVNGTASASDQTSATASSLQSGKATQQVLNAGLSQIIPLGGQFSFGFNNNRQTSNNSFVSINPAYNSGLSLTYNQPLLRNFGNLATDYNILVAQNNSEQSRQQFQFQVVATTQSVINAYWALVGARQQLIVAQESLSLAKELHERNRIQVEVGTIAPLELVSSEANIATNEEAIITAKAAVADAEDVLRGLLNFPPGPLWQAEIRPTTDPVIDRVQINLDEALQSALATRPEIKTQELVVAQSSINQKYAYNQLKPSLNLQLAYNTSGVGGDVIVRDPNTGEILRVIPGGFSDAFSQVTGFNFTGWSAQLVFSYPLQNRTARATAVISDLDQERTTTALDQLRQSVITEVRTATRKVDTAAKSIDAARIARQFQEKNLDAERKKYENGLSTSFQITTIQQNVTAAKSNEVNTVITYRTALADYYRAIGKLLDVQGVQIDDPADPVKRWHFSLFG
ncbi:MAG TPA: TolC family protein [Thermoanaerobaculia bacterium]|jgi:outer membrane protein TolC|nr:TolC family protein [Thermoanaerobaculia bacterium]